MLQQTADPAVADAIQRADRRWRGPRTQPGQCAGFRLRRGLDEERVIAAFLHAAGSAFSSCRGTSCARAAAACWAGRVAEIGASDQYSCVLCAAGYEPTLDEMVEVTFTVTPRVRRIAAHDPHSLPIWEYYRQIFWSRASTCRTMLERMIGEVDAGHAGASARRKGILSLQLPAGFVILFEPVSHAAQFLKVRANRRGSART